MKNQKIIALILASTMVAGSSMIAIAADQTGNTTSTGTLIPHLNREIIDVTLPTNTTTVFNYNIDPERIINDANKLINGSTVTTVTPNDNGVYFANAGTAAVNGTISSNIAANTGNNYVITVPDPTKNTTYTYDGTDWKDSDGTTVAGITVKESDGTTAGTLAANDTITVTGGAAAGQGSYSNTSDAVKFEGKNSVDVDVTVAATVAAGSNDIALVADEEALAAATTPALLMTMKVGDTSKAITSTGATSKAKIAGVADNFEVTIDTNNKYKFDVKSTPTKAWDFTTVQLVGKTNQKTLPDATATAMTVPVITLTWTITKADASAFGSWGDGSLWLAKDASTGFSTTGLTVEVSDGGVTYNSLAADKYTVNDAGWINITWANIVGGIGSEPTGTVYVRITDGSTKYVFESK